MDVTIDNAGRIVLPKPIRDRLGLHGGSTVHLTVNRDAVTLTPAGQRSSLVSKGRTLVHTGKLPPGYDILRAIDDERTARDRDILGLG